MRPLVSIVIATYNRRESLLRTLDSLASQTYPAELLEIIVVNDGGAEDLGDMCATAVPSRLRYIHQPHAGGTQAKNAGASKACGEILMFLDDDITVVPEYVSTLVELHEKDSFVIVLGVLFNVNPSNGQILGEASARSTHGAENREASFLDCLGGFFSIRHSDFLALGMLEDPAPGWWPNWEDVDLAYRAHIKGMRFHRNAAAIGYHWDHSLASREKSFQRWERAARSSVFLFQKHPALRYEIPMFRDKNPIEWRLDPLTLIMRKLARQVVSSRPAMWVMKQIVLRLERYAPGSKLLVLLCRWITSGYIFRGYRMGLNEAAGREPKLIRKHT